LTAEDALARHGFTWDRLVQLARGALRDRMRDRRSFLDPDRYEEALELYVEVGAAWARVYDAERAGGVSFASSCYRRMYPRLTDFLRKKHGDQRRGTPLVQIPTDPTTLPLGGPDVEPESFDNEVATLASRLPQRARWTLEQLGRPIAEEDLSLAEAAARAGVTVEYADDLLEELGWRLGRAPMDAADGGAAASEEFDLMKAWASA
jgi:hypothetical protein